MSPAGKTRARPRAAGEVERLRERIERTDDALLDLIVRRTMLARAIGRAKARAGLPVLDPAREARVVRRAAANARARKLPVEGVRSLFWGIIALCRSEQLPTSATRPARKSPVRSGGAAAGARKGRAR